tara:strand:+ start:129 stop:326 length:198 start_codon:yes stop_codon:yes gene_type:complete
MAITEKACTQIQSTLECIEQYFEERQNADHDGMNHVPNHEMHLLGELLEARVWIDQLIRSNHVKM